MTRILTWKTGTHAESVGNEGVKLPRLLQLGGAARKTPTRGSGGAYDAPPVESTNDFLNSGISSGTEILIPVWSYKHENAKDC